MKICVKTIVISAIALLIFIPGAYGISFGGGISTSTSGYSQGNTVVAGQSLNSVFGSSGSTVDKNYYVKDLDSKYAEIKLHYEGGTVTGYSNVLLPKSGNVFSKPTQVSAEQKFTAVNAKLIRAQEKASNKPGDVASTSIEVSQGSISNYDGKATTTASGATSTQNIGDALGASVKLKEDATFGSQGSHVDTTITQMNGFGADFKGTTESKAGTVTSALLNGHLSGALVSTGIANSLTKTRNSNGQAVDCDLNMHAYTGSQAVDSTATFFVTPDRKIQGAIDAAWAADVVNVAAGSYHEAVNMNKGVILKGAGDTTTRTDSFTLNAKLGTGSGGITAPLVNVNSAGSIQDGVTLTAQGGKVNVAAGYYTENVRIDNKRLSIIGAGQGNTIVDGSLGVAGVSGSVFYIGSGSDVDMSGMTIQGGTGTDKGFSIKYGGGIHNFGSLKLTDSTISSNTAYWGGGIHNEEDATAMIAGCIIESNHCGNGAGGGISNYGTVTITDSIINLNSADFGGGILNYGTVTITDSTISSNKAQTSGGGLVNYVGDMLIDGNTKIRYNQATGNPWMPDISTGGGIYTTSGTLRFAGTSEVSYNKAKQPDSEPDWYTGWGVFSEPTVPTTITFGPGWNPTDYVFGNSKLT